MLKARFFTAIVLLPIVLWVLLFASPVVFLYATGAILLLAGWEWSRLMGLTHLGARFLYFYLLCMLQIGAFFIPPLITLALSAIWWVIAIILIVFYPRYEGWASRFARGCMGVFVLIPFVIGLNYLRSWPDGNKILIAVLVLVWIADIAAYFVGRRYGATKLAPLVSPGKTIEGLVGAMVGATIYLIILITFTDHLSLYKNIGFVILGLTTVFFSVIGDLFESMLKRIVGVKDSGTLLPGHGGILDRIDSLTSAIPIFTVGMILLNYYF